MPIILEKLQAIAKDNEKNRKFYATNAIAQTWVACTTPFSVQDLQWSRLFLDWFCSPHDNECMILDK